MLIKPFLFVRFSLYFQKKPCPDTNVFKGDLSKFVTFEKVKKTHLAEEKENQYRKKV